VPPAASDACSITGGKPRSSAINRICLGVARSTATDGICLCCLRPSIASLAIWWNCFASHLALRDADPIERERLKAEKAAQLAEQAKRIRALLGRPQVLPKANAAASTTLNPSALAAQIRALMVQNDPDVLRAGLAEIACQLDGMAASSAGQEAA
jgi:hypothetical protein